MDVAFQYEDKSAGASRQYTTLEGNDSSPDQNFLENLKSSSFEHQPKFLVESVPSNSETKTNNDSFHRVQLINPSLRTLDTAQVQIVDQDPACSD
jgi:hypothetical protein